MPEESQIERLARMLSVPSVVSDVARNKWSSARNSILEAISKVEGSKAEAIALQDRYLSIRFFCDDMRDLIDYHSLVLDKALTDNYEGKDKALDKQIFVPDAHLFLAFSDRSSESVQIHDTHQGFSFLSSENIDASSNEDDDRYRLFVYDSIFKDENVSLTEASRTELTRTMSYLHDVALDEAAVKISRQDGVARLLDSLYHSWFVARITNKEFNPLEAFNRLMSLAGGPLARQRLAFARFIEAIKRGKFQSPELSVARALAEHREEFSEELVVFSNLLRLSRNNPSIVAASRAGLHQSYEEFLVGSNLETNRPLATQRTRFRGGELFDLMAIHELHVLNTFLEVAGLPCRFRYVTMSKRIFDFLRMFDRKHLRVPLVHPRNAFLYRNKSVFSEHVQDFRHLLSHTVASGRSIQTNHDISTVELDDFEGKSIEIIKLVKHDFTHAVADKQSEREMLIGVLNTTLSMLENPTEEQKEKKNRIAMELIQQLKAQVDGAKSDIGNVSNSLETMAREAYESHLAPMTNSAHLITRTYHADDPNTSRIVCLPTSGSYRHLFVVHQTPDMAAKSIMTQSSVSMMSFKNMKEAVEKTTIGKETNPRSNKLEDRLKRSIVLFLHSHVAGSNKDWTLANSTIEQSHEALRDAKDKKTDNGTMWNYFGFSKDALAGEDVWLKAKAMLQDQEILYFSQFCKRALSESSGSVQRRESWLRRARLDLNESAQRTLQVPRHLANFDSSINPVSVRQSLAAIGLAVEWLVHVNDVSRNTMSRRGQRELEAILPSTGNSIDAKAFAWYHIEILSHPIGGKNDALEILEAIQILVDRIRVCYTEILVEPKDHSPFFWRYLLLRAISLKFFLMACIDCGLVHFDLERSGEPLVKEEDLAEMQNMLALNDGDYISLISQGKAKITAIDDSNDVVDDQFKLNFPFLRAMLSYAKLRMISGNTAGPPNRKMVANQSDLLEEYARLVKVCHRLDPFGFSRRVVRAIKDRYKNVLIDSISGIRN